MFYILADRNNCLEKMIGTSISERLEMANGIISETGGTKIRSTVKSTATTVDTRLKRESNR